MNEPTLYQENLPNTIEDLSRFVLVGREKLTAVRAEIRAIDKVQLAREVRDQKRDEARMMSEALLDAEVRLGDMIKVLPKVAGGDRKSDDFKNRTTAKFEKPKCEVIAELGFSKDQANRFEILADNKDLVEQAKAEARENDDIPTRTQVLNLAKARNDRNLRELKQIDEDYENMKLFWKRINELEKLDTGETYLATVLRAATLDKEESREFKVMFGEEDDSIDCEIERLDKAISKLNEIRSYFLAIKAKGGIYE